MLEAFRGRRRTPTGGAGGGGESPPRRRARRLLTALVLALGVGAAPTAVAAQAEAATAAQARKAASDHFGSRTFRNPISHDFADTFADPAVILGKDGFWYAFATTDPLEEGEFGPDGKPVFHQIPIARSRNLTDWRYVGDAFTAATRPTWADPAAGIWAPDVRFIDGQYVMYFGVTNTTLGDPAHRNDSAIGVATAPTPAGPWTVQGGPVVGPRQNPAGGDNYFWTFDATGFTDIQGNHYLYYGSYYGGIWVTRLTDDGLRAVGGTADDIKVAIDNRYEAPYVIYRDGFYYFFASSANCCAGPTTGYSVYVGRSQSPTGPFVDREGLSLNQSEVGGTIVITPNGNRWVGPGHNSIITDLAGQDWFVYHAIDRNDPYLNEPFGINERPMLMDRLDWIGGWPVVRGGAFASDSPQRAPVTKGLVRDNFNRTGKLGARWSAGGTFKLVAGDPTSRGFLRQTAANCATRFLTTHRALPNDLRVEADVRVPNGGSGGLVVRYVDRRNYAAAYINARTGYLVIDVYVDGKLHSREATGHLDDIDLDEWLNLAVEVRGNQLMAEVTESRLNDPLAVRTVTLPAALASGRAGLATACGRVEFDNFSAARLYVPRTEMAGVPTVGGTVAYEDDFNDGTVGGAGWTWVRGPAAGVTEADGMLRWPTEAADIVGTGNNASLLLRDAPTGNYVIETKCTIDFGTDVIRNFQQCGLIAHVTDDHWVRLSNVSIWNTRQTEFGKEQPFATGLSFGGMLIGPSEATLWLRLAHRVDPANGEHEFRAATSRDGQNWIWGGVWTLPADTNPRIGLLSLGWNGEATGCEQLPGVPEAPCRATSQFDYFRVTTGGTWMR